MKVSSIFTCLTASFLLSTGCSQLPEPVKPIAQGEVDGTNQVSSGSLKPNQEAPESNVLACTPIVRDICSIWSSSEFCGNVVVGVSCEDDGVEGGGYSTPDVHTTSQFRTRGVGGSLNFSVKYYNYSVTEIGSTRQAIAGSTISYTFDGYNISSQAGDGSFDFIAYITLVDSSLPTTNPDHIQHYRLFISYDKDIPTNIATITSYNRVY